MASTQCNLFQSISVILVSHVVRPWYCVIHILNDAHVCPPATAFKWTFIYVVNGCLEMISDLMGIAIC